MRTLAFVVVILAFVINIVSIALVGPVFGNGLGLGLAIASAVILTMALANE